MHFVQKLRPQNYINFRYVWKMDWIFRPQLNWFSDLLK